MGTGAGERGGGVCGGDGGGWRWMWRRRGMCGGDAGDRRMSEQRGAGGLRGRRAGASPGCPESSSGAGAGEGVMEGPAETSQEGAQGRGHVQPQVPTARSEPCSRGLLCTKQQQHPPSFPTFLPAPILFPLPPTPSIPPAAIPLPSLPFPPTPQLPFNPPAPHPSPSSPFPEFGERGAGCSWRGAGDAVCRDSTERLLCPCQGMRGARAEHGPAGPSSRATLYPRVPCRNLRPPVWMGAAGSALRAGQLRQGLEVCSLGCSIGCCSLLCLA